MLRWRTAAIVVAALTVAAAVLVLGRGHAKRCASVSAASSRVLYAISSEDIGAGLSCSEVRSVLRAWVREHRPRQLAGWTFAYHRDCQCHTAERVVAGRRHAFMFDLTSRKAFARR